MSTYDPFQVLPPAFQGTTPQGGDDNTTRWAQLARMFPPQWGDSFELRTPGSLLAGPNVLRWQGEDTDVAVFRMYLGPWQPKADITNAFSAIAASYAQPVAWEAAQPGRYDSMGVSNGTLQMFGRVTFGTGGQKHVAYVDWPRRGLLLQVGGSYLQLDGLALSTSIDPAAIVQNRLPILQATLAPEPGGGDAAAPATYTYPIAAAVGAPPTRLFQVPPFARTFTPLIDRTALGALTVQIRAREVPGGTITDAWIFDGTVATPPLGGPVEVQLPIPSQTGVIEMQIASEAAFSAGCLFHLDL